MNSLNSKIRMVALALLVLTTFAYAQNKGLEQGVGSLGRIVSGKPLHLSFDSSTKIDGSEYLNEKWSSAEITTVNNQKTTLEARFNAYTQELEVLDEDDKPLALSHTIIDKVMLSGKKFRPAYDENSNAIFAEELVAGKINIYKKYTAYIKASSFKPGIQTTKPNDKILIKESLLYNVADTKEFLPLSAKKKDILAIINKDSNTLDFVKKNKLSYKKESDIVKIFNFYNKKD